MIMSKPTGSLLRDLALLSLVPEQDVLQFFNTRESDLQKAKNEGFAREQWKKHKLYREKKDKLVKFCSERKLETFGMKYELVERLALAEDEEPPTPLQPYNGTIKLPTTMNEISKLPVCYLQSVLTWNGLASCGTKDELIIRVSVIVNNRMYLCFNRERKMFLDLIIMAKNLILEEKKQRLLSDSVPTYRHRTFSTPTTTSISSDRPRYNAAVQVHYSDKSCLEVPEGTSLDNVDRIFEQLVQHINSHFTGKMKSHESAGASCKERSSSCEDTILQQGARVCASSIYL